MVDSAVGLALLLVSLLAPAPAGAVSTEALVDMGACQALAAARGWGATMAGRYDGFDGQPVAPPPGAQVARPGAPAWEGWHEVALAWAIEGAAQAGDAAAQHAFYEGAWREMVLPRLAVAEEAMMQMVAHRAAYLPPHPGVSLPLPNLGWAWAEAGPPAWPDGTPVAYAGENVIVDILPTAEVAHPVVAFLTLPPEGQAGPALIVFRGTDSSSRSAQCGLPTGVKEDLDPKGVGHAAFAANRPVLQAWVARAQAQGRGVVILGHSLGGTLATRLFASLEPGQQSRARLLAFAPAGLEREAVASIVPGLGNVKTILHVQDWVVGCGTGLAPGYVIAYGADDGLFQARFHTEPALAAWLLGWSPDPGARLWTADALSSGPLGVVEAVRRWGLGPLWRAWSGRCG